MARLFVAVHPPDDVLDLVAALPRPAEPGVRYTTRPQWHVTLRFLGEADVAEAAAALDAVEAVPAGAELGPQVSRLGRNVVVVPVHGLDALVESVRVATAGVGEPPDPRPFAGHLTVARLRRRGACRIAGEPISARFRAESFDLVRSQLHPDEARYETVGSWHLGVG